MGRLSMGNLRLPFHRHLVAVTVVHAYPSSLLVRQVYSVHLRGFRLGASIQYIPLGVN